MTVALRLAHERADKAEAEARAAKASLAAAEAELHTLQTQANVREHDLHQCIGELERTAEGYLLNAAGDCSACAEAVACGSASVPHKDCIVTAVVMLRAQIDRERAEHREALAKAESALAAVRELAAEMSLRSGTEVDMGTGYYADKLDEITGGK